MRRHAIEAVLGLLLLAGFAPACNVPVFRFALEKWKPETYQVTLFHRGPLDEQSRAVLELLRNQGPTEVLHCNLDFTVVDLANKPDEAQVTLYEKLGKPALPWMLVQTKNLDEEMVAMWSGKPTQSIIAKLVNSPARRELVKRLLHGDTAVWVLLDCGDKTRDDAAETLLAKELKRLEGVLKLPVLTDDPDDRLAAKGPPLRLGFSIIRVGQDETEQMLRTMLLKSESDIEESKSPKAFPIFGRGRTLGGLIAGGLRAEVIAESCGLLIAPCSCKVKREMPGFDLLLSADWDVILESGPVERQRAGEKVPLPPGKPKPSEPPQEPAVEAEPTPLIAPMVLYGGIGVAGVLVLLTGVWMLRSGWSGTVAV